MGYYVYKYMHANSIFVNGVTPIILLIVIEIAWKRLPMDILVCMEAGEGEGFKRPLSLQNSLRIRQVFSLHLSYFQKQW